MQSALWRDIWRSLIIHLRAVQERNILGLFVVPKKKTTTLYQRILAIFQIFLFFQVWEPYWEAFKGGGLFLVLEAIPRKSGHFSSFLIGKFFLKKKG